MNDVGLPTLLLGSSAEQGATMQQLLDGAGGKFCLQAVSSLEEGIERLKAQSFRLVLLDLNLPGAGVLESYMRVAGVAPAAAIVMLGARSEAGAEGETLVLGAEDYWVKGEMDPQLLVFSLQRALERKTWELKLKEQGEGLERMVGERTAAQEMIINRLQGELAERKRAEREALASNRELVAALEEMEKIRSVANAEVGSKHELGLVLGVIRECRRMLRLENLGAGEMESVLDRFESSALEGFELLAVKEKESRGFSLNSVVQQALALAGLQEEIQGLMVQTCLEALPRVQGDPRWLREHLVEFISRAKADHSGCGTIRIETNEKDGGPRLEIFDDGEPLTAEGRQSWLQKLQVEPKTLGNDAEEMKVEVQSGAGQGTTLELHWPVRGAAKAEPLANGSKSHGLKILVVDDEPLIREVISVYLQMDDHVITEAGDGKEGLEKFRDGDFDLVMTDRAMPLMNGDQMALAIREIKPRQPVVMLTGFGDQGNRQVPGIDLIVGKPFTLETLREAIAVTISKWASATN